MRIPIKITGYTLLGIRTRGVEFPLPMGNHFYLEVPDTHVGEFTANSGHKVLNFRLENFQEACRRFKLDDVNVEIEGDFLRIVDDRIPVEWYTNR